MKRTLSLLLALLLALGCLSPALALEPPAPRFDDVDPDAWYAPYVETCVVDGLMEGVGDEKFAPEKTLSGTECSVLALRLYDLLHGGDGDFDPAPEDWGYATFTFPDGQSVQGYIQDGAVWNWIKMSRVDGGHLCFRLETEDEQAWGKSMDYQKAAFSMNGVDCPGELHLSGDSLLYFEPTGNWEAFRDLTTTYRYPWPHLWYRDAWYYAEQKDLHVLIYSQGDRRAFARCVAEAVGELPAINDIFALPDTAEPDVLMLCRAGVLTGTDQYGTFRINDSLTRAQAAAIACRVLHPELRVEYTIQPLETYENYTLTYLQDDGERRFGLPKASEYLVNADDHTLLTLDGTAVSTPEGWEIERVGAQDVCIHDAIGTYGVMDAQGNVTPAEWWEARERPGETQNIETLNNGYRRAEYSCCYWNAQGEQVSPVFDWLGPINPDGQGFVGLDGKIYRIDFAQ